MLLINAADDDDDDDDFNEVSAYCL